MAKFFSGELKNILTSGAKSKIAALMILKNIKDFRKRMDYSEYGGAPLLGTAKPVIKAHGNSDAAAFSKAIKIAINYAELNIPEKIKESINANKDKKLLT